MSIKGIIDTMFVTTKQLFVIEFVVYSLFYYIPLLCQIFYFTGSSGIIFSNMLCLITNFGFFYLETIQMRY